MGFRLFCDKCKSEISNKQDQVKVEVQLGNRYYYKYFHKDCFNYHFSTDIERIKDEQI